MIFSWAKNYIPRSLYARAALILLVPVVTLQLVVSVVFIQRHFAGVTEQMTRNLAIELRYLLTLADAATDSEAASQSLLGVAEPLGFEITLPDTPPGRDALAFYDLSGKRMIETLRDQVQGTRVADVTQANRRIEVWFDTRHGAMSVVFDRRRVSASNPHQLLVLMTFTGILVTLVAFVFLRNQLRPIKRLARASEAFGKGRIEAYKPAGALEVRAAGKAFLDMRARIERQIEQRTMMLSGVSHDLRTPLTRLKLGLAMLDEDQDADAMLRDVGDMERLLDEFLTFARDDSLDDPKDCDPVVLVRDIVARFQAAGNAVELSDVTGSGVARLRPMAVTRALENLIGNAVRYGRKCQVRLAITARWVRISVEDDGPGIPADRRDEALKPFVRLDAARNQNRGSGVGLGLAIAGDIAHRHGGALELGSGTHLPGLKADLVLAR